MTEIRYARDERGFLLPFIAGALVTAPLWLNRPYYNYNYNYSYYSATPYPPYPPYAQQPYYPNYPYPYAPYNQYNNFY